MHVIFLADESILPTDHGGRLAMSNDVAALVSAGFTVSLIVSVEAPQSSDMDGHYSYEFRSPVHFVQQRTADAAARSHPSIPRPISVRLPDDEALRALRAFLDTQPIPTAIIASRENTLLLGDWVATSSRAPLFLRSHNDEIGYARMAASNSSSAEEARELRRTARILKGAFRKLLKPVTAVALISPADAHRYRKIGKKTSVVPALVAEVPTSVPPFEARNCEAMFIGSMSMPHTAAGIKWFVQRVWPIVLRSLPTAKLTIAGRGASDELKRIFAQAEGVVHLGRVDDVQVLLDSGRVFVNPVFKGSGVNMKLAQPAARGVPIVATKFGMRGVPALSAIVNPSNSPSRLARQTLRYLTAPREWHSASTALQDVMTTSYSTAESARAWREFLPEPGGSASD